MMHKHRYGYRRDLPDQRDHVYSAPRGVLQALPQSVDLRSQFPDPPFDQGNLGSCVSNAAAAFVQFLLAKQKLQVFMPSRLFIYYNGRLKEGTVNSDSGESVRDGVKTINQIGAPPETDWDYDITKFTQRPPQKAYKDATLTKALQYQRVMQSLTQLMGCLASGFPVIFGSAIYESFESSVVEQTGVVPMPSPREQMLGGHCMLLCGYDTTKRVFLVRNSWGNFGDKGHLYIPLSYITNTQITSDLWTIRSVS